LAHGLGNFRSRRSSATLPDSLAGALQLLTHQVNHPFPAVGSDYPGKGISSQHAVYAGQITELHLSLTFTVKGRKTAFILPRKKRGLS
jgi:hypothetical protein